jgi:hypothetical protein
MMDTILTLLTPSTILFAFLGLFVGMATGVLPGFGPSGAMGILFPMTFYMAPHEALIVLFAIYYGSQYGDNIAATTMRIAHGSSIVICQDGYELAKQGKAGKALAIGAISTLVAGLPSRSVSHRLASVGVGVEFRQPRIRGHHFLRNRASHRRPTRIPALGVVGRRWAWSRARVYWHRSRYRRKPMDYGH